MEIKELAVGAFYVDGGERRNMDSFSLWNKLNIHVVSKLNWPRTMNGFGR